MKNIEELMKMDYRISLRKDEDGDYIAAVDELPGCVADGRSPNKAVENVREAMKSWMTSRAEAGLEIPEPRDASEYSGKLVIRMPRSLHKKLSALAACEGASLNQHIVSTLSEACGRAYVAEVQATEMLKAIYTNITRIANSRVPFAAPVHWTGQQAFGMNATPFLNSGTCDVVAGVRLLHGSPQDASVFGWVPEEDEQQKQIRQVLSV